MTVGPAGGERRHAELARLGRVTRARVSQIMARRAQTAPAVAGAYWRAVKINPAEK
jgi:hypothetical protein